MKNNNNKFNKKVGIFTIIAAIATIISTLVAVFSVFNSIDKDENHIFNTNNSNVDSISLESDDSSAYNQKVEIDSGDNNAIVQGNDNIINNILQQGDGTNIVNINTDYIEKSTYGEERWEIIRLNENYDVEIGSNLVFDFAINTPPSQSSTPYILCGGYLIKNQWQYFLSIRVPAEQSHIKLTIDTFKMGFKPGTYKFNFGLFRSDDYSEGNGHALHGAIVNFYGDETPYQGSDTPSDVIKYEFLDYYIIQGIEYAMDTESLSLANVTDIDIKSIACLKKLKKLSILGSSITNIEPLKSLKNLESLDIHSNNLRDITPIKDMVTLTSLSLGGEQINGIGAHGILEDISPIKNLTKLKTLMIYDCIVEDIDCVRQLKMLKSLFVFKTEVKDISALSELNFVEYLYLHSNKINDITPIDNLPNLIHITISNNNLTNEQINDFKEEHPNCRVV